MPLGEYLTGAFFSIGTVGAALAAAHVVVRRRYRYLPPLPRSLAFVTIATLRSCSPRSFLRHSGS